MAMDTKRLLRVIIVYIILILSTWLLTQIVTISVYYYLGNQWLVKDSSNLQMSYELDAFLDKHVFSELKAKEEMIRKFDNLSPKDKSDFKAILLKSVKLEDVMKFSSIFTVCVIVFSLIGLTSGLLTRSWIPAGIFPIVILLTYPFRHFLIYGYMSGSQKLITVLVGQFATCYLFAYLGAVIANRFLNRRNANMPVHSDAPEGSA